MLPCASRVHRQGLWRPGPSLHKWFLHLYLKEASSVHFQVGLFEQGPDKEVQNCLAAQISCVDTSTSFQQQLHGLKETNLHAPAINSK